MKKAPAPTAPFDQIFFEEIPMVDKKGKPIPWDPPLSKISSPNKKTTADHFNDNFGTHKKKSLK